MDNLSIDKSTLPRHVAIIMDGNGRWAQGNGFPRVEGHKAGVKTVRRIVEEARKLGIKYLTLFSFSTENWNRPASEVTALMSLFKQHLDAELELLKSNDIKLRVIGDLSKLPLVVRRALKRNVEETKNLGSMELILAMSYGGRDEIVNAARRIAMDFKSGVLKEKEITEELFANYLYAPDVPNPELLIRTSNESRVSNFLLWQIAYSEIVVSPVLWPEFSNEEFYRCLNEYATRERRFGLTAEQLVTMNKVA